ncbi:hypothetical protein POM88_012184 [Heracleum sosnowskyi]|uniref:XS domain-containing protein n=1 Tax=Heracleum sosnowskyi TaxID=360622 RepID=A0AAD8IXK1_9APIA|nr:hypothetical protein POM88_012184 [Heracleum sosnowskyi]
MHVGRLNSLNQSSYRGCENNYSQPAVTPHRSYKSVVAKEDNLSTSRPAGAISDEEEENDDDTDSNENDDIYDSDECDTDESQKSHETRKKNRLLKDFFGNLDKMNLDEIKKLHCPACQSGPGAITWNTLLEQDDDGKWLGMGNAELLEYFSAFEALSKHFEDEGIGQEAWDRCRDKFIPGGQRQLYGYMARKRDLDSFNQHANGKPLQKFEMRSYQEVVISQLKQMSKDNHLLLWNTNKVEKLKKELEVLKGSYEGVAKKMRKVSAENDILRQRTRLYHKQKINEEDTIKLLLSGNFVYGVSTTDDDLSREIIIVPARAVLVVYYLNLANEFAFLTSVLLSSLWSANRIEIGTTSILSQQKDICGYICGREEQIAKGSGTEDVRVEEAAV